MVTMMELHRAKRIKMRELEGFAVRPLRLVYGKTSLPIVIREGKPAVLSAAEDAYAGYRLEDSKR